MTQKEKLFYYLDRINNSTELKDEIYWKCGLEIWKPNELQDDLESLMEGGCKQNMNLFHLPVMVMVEYVYWWIINMLP